MFYSTGRENGYELIVFVQQISFKLLHLCRVGIRCPSLPLSDHHTILCNDIQSLTKVLSPLHLSGKAQLRPEKLK